MIGQCSREFVQNNFPTALDTDLSRLLENSPAKIGAKLFVLHRPVFAPGAQDASRDELPQQLKTNAGS